MVTWLPCDDYPLIRTRKKVMGFPHCLTRMEVSLHFSEFKRSSFQTLVEILFQGNTFLGPLIVSKPPLVAAKMFDVLTLAEVYDYDSVWTSSHMSVKTSKQRVPLPSLTWKISWLWSIFLWWRWCHILQKLHIMTKLALFSLSSQKDRLLWSVGSEKSGNNLDKICQK